MLAEANLLKSRVKHDAAFWIPKLLCYLTTMIDFLATLAFFCFSSQGHRTIGTEAPDPQKSKIKHVSLILSETMDG